MVSFSLSSFPSCLLTCCCIFPGTYSSNLKDGLDLFYWGVLCVVIFLLCYVFFLWVYLLPPKTPGISLGLRGGCSPCPPRRRACGMVFDQCENHQSTLLVRQKDLPSLTTSPCQSKWWVIDCSEQPCWEDDFPQLYLKEWKLIISLTAEGVSPGFLPGGKITLGHCKQICTKKLPVVH